jgi:selenocysteine lyase/cysteine desulfurase
VGFILRLGRHGRAERFLGATEKILIIKSLVTSSVDRWADALPNTKRAQRHEMKKDEIIITKYNHTLAP